MRSGARENAESCAVSGSCLLLPAVAASATVVRASRDRRATVAMRFQGPATVARRSQTQRAPEKTLRPSTTVRCPVSRRPRSTDSEWAAVFLEGKRPRRRAFVALRVWAPLCWPGWSRERRPRSAASALIHSARDSWRENTCIRRSAAVFPRNPRIFARGGSRILLGQSCHRGAASVSRQTPMELRFSPKNVKRTLKNAFRSEIRSSLKRLGPALAKVEGSSLRSFRKHALSCGDQPKKCSTASETYQNGSRTVRNKFLTPPGGLLVAGF